MNNASNSIYKELRDWAFDTNADWPTQDFDITIGELSFSKIILELAVDQNCPKQIFFLQCAYFIVGDAVLTDFQTESKEDITNFLNQASNTDSDILLSFVKRSKELMRNPTKFDYDHWCDGGLAKSEIKSYREAD